MDSADRPTVTIQPLLDRPLGGRGRLGESSIERLGGRVAPNLEGRCGDFGHLDGHGEGCGHG